MTDSCNGSFNLLLCLELAVSPTAPHHLADLKRCFRSFSDLALTGHWYSSTACSNWHLDTGKRDFTKCLGDLSHGSFQCCRVPGCRVPLAWLPALQRSGLLGKEKSASSFNRSWGLKLYLNPVRCLVTSVSEQTLLKCALLYLSWFFYPSVLSFNHGTISSVRHLLLCAEAHHTSSALGYKGTLRIPFKGFFVTFPFYGKKILCLSLVSSLYVQKSLETVVGIPCALSSAGRPNGLKWP